LGESGESGEEEVGEEESGDEDEEEEEEESSDESEEGDDKGHHECDAVKTEVESGTGLECLADTEGDGVEDRVEGEKEGVIKWAEIKWSEDGSQQESKATYAIIEKKDDTENSRLVRVKRNSNHPVNPLQSPQPTGSYTCILFASSSSTSKGGTCKRRLSSIPTSNKRTKNLKSK
jgi:hypothetical protein